MSQSDSGYSLFGAIALIVVGLVIFIPSGLCTGVFALGPIFQLFGHPISMNKAFGVVAFPLVIGGPFVLLGIGMIWSGIKKIRTIKRKQ